MVRDWSGTARARERESWAEMQGRFRRHDVGFKFQWKTKQKTKKARGERERERKYGRPKRRSRFCQSPAHICNRMHCTLALCLDAVNDAASTFSPSPLSLLFWFGWSRTSGHTHSNGRNNSVICTQKKREKDCLSLVVRAHAHFREGRVVLVLLNANLWRNQDLILLCCCSFVKSIIPLYKQVFVDGMKRVLDQF